FYFFCFFFSSRRRHTRSKRDWSSDVCSSDLDLRRRGGPREPGAAARHLADDRRAGGSAARVARPGRDLRLARRQPPPARDRPARSEERRVGKEWRSWGRRGRWSTKKLGRSRW